MEEVEESDGAVCPEGGQGQVVGGHGTELLGRSQPCDIRRKGVSGTGNSGGKGPEVGTSWCVGGKETRLGCKRLGLRS